MASPTPHADDEDDDERVPCPTCGRQFGKEPLIRHIPICKTTLAKKRKVFDSAKQRTLGEELTYRQIKEAQKKVLHRPNRNWRGTHEQLVSSLRNARATQSAIKSGDPLPPPPPPTINPDYVQCETCGRRFNETAAARHVPFCAERQKRLSTHTASKTKNSAMALRKQYKPPMPKTQQIKDSSSNNSTKQIKEPLSPPNGHSHSQRNGQPVPAFRPHNELNRKDSLSGRAISPGTCSPSDLVNGNYEVDLISNRSGSGRALRTGKSPQVYEDAKHGLALKKIAYRTQSNHRLVPGALPRNPVNCNPLRPLSHKTVIDASSGKSKHQSNGNMGYNSVKSKAHTSRPIKFCHECGSPYPIVTARFCSECGMKRLLLS